MRANGREREESKRERRGGKERRESETLDLDLD